MLVATVVVETVPWLVMVGCAKAVTPPATCLLGEVASGMRSSKVVPMPLYPVVEAFAIFPEMFCSAKDCACRPPTEVLSASKIPITSSANSFSGTDRGTAVIERDIAGDVPRGKMQSVQRHDAKAPAARPGHICRTG